MTTLREIEPDEAAALQTLIESDPAYVERVTGHPPGPADARDRVVETNAAVADPFWSRMGYSPTGEPRSYLYDKLETTVRIWTRPVHPEGAD